MLVRIFWLKDSSLMGSSSSLTFPSPSVQMVMAVWTLRASVTSSHVPGPTACPAD